MAQITVSINGERLDERIDWGSGGTLIVFREDQSAIEISREKDGDPISIFDGRKNEYGFTVNIPDGGTYPIEDDNEKIIIEHGVNS